MGVITTLLALFSTQLPSSYPREKSLLEEPIASWVNNFIPAEIEDISDPLALNMVHKHLHFKEVILSHDVADAPVLTCCPVVKEVEEKTPLVFIHGFDSSCLEYRRLLPQLASQRTLYFPDILGWGFTDCSAVKDFSPKAKLEHLRCVLDQVVQQPCILVGASLGGGIAINLATEVCPEMVRGVILLDAQGFIDGQGPSKAPDFIAQAGISVLKSRPLRMYANSVAYFNKALANEEAYRIGRLHCALPHWDRANKDFLLAGGFVVSPNVPRLKKPTLIVWGAQDGILDLNNAFRFEHAIEGSELFVIDRCGHVPHLEKPAETAVAIMSFLERAKL